MQQRVGLFVKDKAFYKMALAISIPIIMQSMITIGINMIDTLMVGQLGELPLSATSLANEFINIYHILCMGMGYGAAVLTAQYWGSQDIDALKKIVTIMLRLCVSIAVIFTVAAVLFPDRIMRIYTPDEKIVQQGILYFGISALTFVPTGLSLTITAILRSTRQVKVPLYRISLNTSLFAISINFLLSSPFFTR